VIKGMITAEEAQDYPEEAKPRGSKDITPRNPLDAIAPPEPVREPQQIEAAMADTVEPISDNPEVVALETEDVADAPQPLEVVANGYPLLSSSSQFISTHAEMEEWQDAYEDMADRIARAGKREPRERMTILKEFKQANEETLAKVDTVKRVRHTAAYSKRIKALGAAQA
jgi:predicted AAA+ superfamily ATPase